MVRWLVIAVCGSLASAGCQQILGIHDSVATGADAPDKPITDGPAPDGPQDGPGPGVCAVLPTFGSETNYDLGGTGQLLAVGDLDHDGRPDVAVTTGTIVIYHGAAGGTLTRKQDVPTAALGVIVVDLDRDGYQDLVAWSGSSVVVRRQDLANPGGFLGEQPLSIALGTIAGVKSGRFDGDSFPDLIVTGQNGKQIYFNHAATPGTFDAGPGVGTGAFAVLDLDGDTHDDLASIQGDAVQIALQDPANPGMFLAPTNVGSGVMGEGAGFGKFNGDGLLDLMIGSGTGGGAALYLQSSANPGTFVQQPGLINGIPGMYMQIVDIDGDGRDDVVTQSQAVMQCAAPAPAGTFSAVVQLGFGFPPVLADLSNDGRADLLRLGGQFLKVRLQ